jgi:hypothetical protein
MKDYVIHATVHYVVKSRETGQTEHGTRRPTLRVRASSEQAAINKARKQQKEQIGTEWWLVVHLSFSAELVNPLRMVDSRA